MAQSLNSVNIMGNITAQPELKEIGETKLAEFSIALNRSRKVDDEWKTETDFINVKAWGYLAEVAAQIEKGSKIGINGELREERWETDDGKKRSKIVLLAKNIVRQAKPDSKADEPKEQSGYDKFKQAGQKVKTGTVDAETQSLLDSGDVIDLDNIPF